MPYPKCIARPGDMLIAEALLFMLQIGMAYIGAVADSGVRRALLEEGLASGWGVVVAGLGVFGLGLTMVEWCHGLGWDSHRLRNANFMRLWCNLISIVTWAYLIHAIAFAPEPHTGVFALVTGPICILFHGWAALVLRREGLILNPYKDTGRLEAQIDRRNPT